MIVICERHGSKPWHGGCGPLGVSSSSSLHRAVSLGVPGKPWALTPQSQDRAVWDQAPPLARPSTKVVHERSPLFCVLRGCSRWLGCGAGGCSPDLTILHSGSLLRKSHPHRSPSNSLSHLCLLAPFGGVGSASTPQLLSTPH